jgi:DNA-binding GntR family transcriptional regulator
MRKRPTENAEHDMDGVGPLERSSLSRRAGDLIRQSIVTGVLQPGETISPQEISERLAVSRTPVREALILLNAIGLVEFHPGRIQIASATPDAVREAFELREALEGKAAGLAAERRSEQEAKQIMDLAISSGEAAAEGNRVKFREHDRAFHLAIARAAHSAQLERYLSYALDLALTLRNLRVAKSPFHPKSVGYHKSIAEAILSKDAAEAESLSRAHVRAVGQNLND